MSNRCKFCNTSYWEFDGKCKWETCGGCGIQLCTTCLKRDDFYDNCFSYYLDEWVYGCSRECIMKQITPHLSLIMCKMLSSMNEKLDTLIQDK